MLWNKKGYQFKEMAGIITKANQRYYIWGAGVFGISFYDMFKDKIDVISFIDSNKTKQGKSIDNVLIEPPSLVDKAIEQGIRIIVATGWTADISEALTQKGMRENVDFFYASDFLSVYMYYKENKIYTLSANFEITTRCTLRCQKCMAFIPYVKDPHHFEVNEIKKDIDTYFEWVDYLATIGIGGGDVLLHPELCEILEYIGERYYRKKIQDIEIYTNAIILPSERLLQLLKKYDVIVRFSDYSINLPGRQRIDELIEILDTNGIRYDRVMWTEWLDIGYPQGSNGKKGEELVDLFDRCLTKVCTIMRDGKLYSCSIHATAVRAGVCEDVPEDFFDMTQMDEGKKAEFIEFNAGYCQNGYVSYCKKCNGNQNVNHLLIPVAEQLPYKKKEPVI